MANINQALINFGFHLPKEADLEFLFKIIKIFKLIKTSYKFFLNISSYKKMKFYNFILPIIKT